VSSLRIEARRGSIVESVHRVSVAVVDPEGRMVARSGDPELVTFLRSAAKPFQAMPLVDDGVVLSSAELALACASHNSEPEHVEPVTNWLSRIGCTENDLACGPHRPLWRDLALQSAVKGFKEVPRARVASNCSGKHTGMLAVAKHHGWPTTGYERPDHPVQQRCLKEMAHWAGVKSNDVGVAVDGCGVSCFALPLSRMARAFARLIAGEGSNGKKVADAMMTHPHLVAGTGRPCTDVMLAYPGEVVAKVGAEGVYGAALKTRGVGVALKVEDGHYWAAVAALVAVLDQFGLEPVPSRKLAAYAEFPARNTQGLVTGSLAAAGEITFV